MSETDPVVAQRRRIDNAARRTRSAGWVLIGLSMTVFAYGAVTEFTDLIVRVVVVALGAATVLLVPAIILGYAVAKADREDPGPSR